MNHDPRQRGFLYGGKNVEIIIVMKNGLVQDVYADGSAIVSVCDFDTTDPNEYQEATEALEEIKNDPTFYRIY